MSGQVLSLQRRGDGIAVLCMDDTAETVNTLKHALIDEMDSVLLEIEGDPDLRVVIFMSGKPDSFIAGADIGMLKSVINAEEAARLADLMHTATNRLERLSAITVAAINGPCLGGGLELALAFDYRVASDNEKTRLGLPEVQLGVLPGGGGTQRLPRLIGQAKALDMLLTGRQLDSQGARRCGLVDDVVPTEILYEAAVKLASRGKRTRTKESAGVWLRRLLFERNRLGRRIYLGQARKRVIKKTRGNYPAPLKIIDTVSTGLNEGLERGLAAEARAFGELAVSSQARQLMNIFFATTDLKKDLGENSSGLDPLPIDKVGVLGAGLMGAGIAYTTLAKTGAAVRLKDTSNESLARGLSHVSRQFVNRVSRKRITRRKHSEAMSRLTVSTDYSGFANCDLVIEAVFEDLALKQKMATDVEALPRQQADGTGTIFATNTSALPIGQIAEAVEHPERVIGMHYFSPVEKMPLLEIVATEKTADWVVASCAEFGRRQGKTVVIVNDGPGFYTTRIIAPYVAEALHLVAEGVSIEQIDTALMDFGFPVGPVKLLDEVGIDVALHIAESLHQAFGERLEPVRGMQQVIDDDRKGRKNKRGFYNYSAGSGSRFRLGRGGTRGVDKSIYKLIGVRPGSRRISNEAIVERCVFMMINEAAYCLEERILRQARDGDIGAIFGLGFPPFLGGPFRYSDMLGAPVLVEHLARLEQECGIRFRPAPNLSRLAASEGGAFYPNS